MDPEILGFVLVRLLIAVAIISLLVGVQIFGQTSSNQETEAEDED